MIGLFRLFILVCAMRKSLAIQRKLLTGRPMPWHLFVSQECKEEAQVMCKECGWANCVPRDTEKESKEEKKEPDDVTCCPNVRKVPNEMSEDDVVENTPELEQCCPENYVFKCCTLLTEQKYSWRAEHVWEFARVDMDCKFGLKSICICDAMAKFMTRGARCCESDDTDCTCCQTDSSITQLPEVFKFTNWGDDRCKSEIKIHETAAGEDGFRACYWQEGAKASRCCDENYVLTRDTTEPIPKPSLRKDWQLTSTEKDDITKWYILPPSMKSMEPSLDSQVKKFWVIRPVPRHAIKPPEYFFYEWFRPKTEDMVAELEKKSETECKDKPVYCVCDPLHFDRMITGMCCDKSTLCECCSTLVRNTASGEECEDQKKHIHDKVPGAYYDLSLPREPEPFCLWTEGAKASSCCDNDYELVQIDERYGELKIQINLTHSALEGISRRHPFCRGRLPMIHPLVCAHEWYYVPKFKTPWPKDN